MNKEPENQQPQRKRPPDSIWERYLTGQLSLEDEETLPALVKELHQEIAQHLGRKDVEQKSEEIGPFEIEPSATSSAAAPKLTPIIDIVGRRSYVATRPRLDPREN